MSVSIRPPTSDAERAWLTGLWRREWGGEVMITCGQTHHLEQVEALIAWEGEMPWAPPPTGWMRMAAN